MRGHSAKWILGALAVAGTAMSTTVAYPHPANSYTSRASCLIDARSVNKLTSATPGTLSKVEVLRGDHVRAGQIIARLESDVEQTMYDAARLKAESDAVVHAREADKENADKKLQRVKQLQTNNYATLAALEDATKEAAVAKYALEQAHLDKDLAIAEAARLKAIIERRLIRSPVDGVVTRVDLHAGEYADATSPVATVAEIRPLLVEVYLPADAYPLVSVGTRAVIKPQEPIGGSLKAEIATKDPQIDSASGMFQLSLLLPNTDEAIPAGLRCTIEFLD